MSIYSTEKGSQAKISSKGFRGMELNKNTEEFFSPCCNCRRGCWRGNCDDDWWWWKWWNRTWPKSWVLPKKANGGYFLRRLSDVSEFQVISNRVSSRFIHSFVKFNSDIILSPFACYEQTFRSVFQRWNYFAWFCRVTDCVDAFYSSCVEEPFLLTLWMIT